MELAAVAVAAFVLASSDSSCAWSHRAFSTCLICVDRSELA